MTGSIISADDFMRGQRHCREGIPHKAGQSKDYDRGYNAEYTKEQVMTALSEHSAFFLGGRYERK